MSKTKQYFCKWPYLFDACSKNCICTYYLISYHKAWINVQTHCNDITWDQDIFYHRRLTICWAPLSGWQQRKHRSSTLLTLWKGNPPVTGGSPSQSADNTEPWWRHQMETFSALLAICAGNSPVNSPHKGQWRGALLFSLICAWINGWVNNGEAGDFRRYRAHYDVIVNGVSIS